MTDKVAGMENDGLEFGGLRNKRLKISSSASVSHPSLVIVMPL